MSNPVLEIVEDLGAECRIRRLRSISDFATQEIVLPSGPAQGERFNLNRVPWNRKWFEAVDSGAWRRFCLTGVGQGGKTLAGSAIPVMYHLFEHRETVIYAAPTLEMTNDKWRQDILPLIESSRYRDLLPKNGRGSRGGNVTSIQFEHGPTLRFLTGGGGDKSRAGFTSRVVVFTESDGLDDEKEASREADAFSQIEARTAAYGDRARIYQECTVSTEEGRTWRELEAGTNCRLAVCCPHCRHYVTPEREHLVGWQDARTAMEARGASAIHCPACGAAWSEDERRAANLDARMVGGAQAVDAMGLPVGDIPPALTFSMRFTAVNNLLVPMVRVAEEEFNAPRTTDAGLAERKLRQFYWATPSEAESVTISEVDVLNIANKACEAARGIVPSDGVKITVGIDVGKWLCHWVAVAWRFGGSPHVLEYGRIEVPSAQMAEEAAILLSLRKFRDESLVFGWPSDKGAMTRPAAIMVDSGNWSSTVIDFCEESKKFGMYWPCKGFGVGQVGNRTKMRDPGYEIVPQKDGHKLVEINADFWKSFVHARIQTPAGQPGSMTLFTGTARDHLSFCKHLTAEKRVEEFQSGRGLVSRWEKVNKNNHFLDAYALACVGGHGAGMARVTTSEAAVKPKPRIVIPGNPVAQDYAMG